MASFTKRLRATGLAIGIAALCGSASNGQTPTDPQQPAAEAAAKEAKDRVQSVIPDAKPRGDNNNSAAGKNENIKDRDDSADRTPESRRRDRVRDQRANDNDRNARERHDLNRHDADDNNARRDRDDRDDRERDANRTAGRDDDRASNRDRGDRQDFGLSFTDETNDGITIGDIEANGIASRSGLRRGDVIHTVNGRRIHSQDDFGRWTSGRSRTPLTVVVLRDGRWQTLMIQPTATAQRTERFYRYNTATPQRSSAYLGITMDARYPHDAIIRHVTPNSPADRADLRSGEAILSVDGEDVRSPEHLTELIAQYQPGDEVELEVSVTDDRTDRIDVELGRRPAARAGRYAQSHNFDQDEYQAYDGRYDRDGNGWNDDAPRRLRARAPYRVR